MSDSLTQEQRSERMSRVRGKDTKPEMVVRRLVYHMGFRYRLHCSDVPGRPDLVFKGRRKVVFVHGCFWHRHPGCKNNRLPKSRLEFWRPKLRRNRERDLEVQKKLKAIGWDFLVIWECETRDAETVKNRIKEFLEG